MYKKALIALAVLLLAWFLFFSGEDETSPNVNTAEVTIENVENGDSDVALEFSKMLETLSVEQRAMVMTFFETEEGKAALKAFMTLSKEEQLEYLEQVRLQIQ